MMRKCSIVIAVFNEESSLKILLEQVIEQLQALIKGQQIGDYEIIFISDGSTDQSVSILKQEVQNHPRCQLVVLRKHCGKSYALSAGFKQATGDIVITMDADLQDDPKELPRFIQKLDEGYDLVSGWKLHRKDPLEKTLPSKLFNYVTSKICAVRLHDFNCGFKAYRRQVIDAVAVYGEFHRYIPVLAVRQGFKITEIPIQHHKRPFGKSKFGWRRYERGLFDAMSVWFLLKYAHCPMYFFGKLALIMFLISIMCGIVGGVLHSYPMIGLAVLIGVAGIISVLLGFIANLLVDYFQQISPSDICVAEIVGCKHEK